MEPMTIKGNDTITIKMTIAMEWYLRSGMFDTENKATKTLEISKDCVEIFKSWKDISPDKKRSFAVLEEVWGNSYLQSTSEDAIWLIQRLQSINLPTHEEMREDIEAMGEDDLKI